ncbi:hypothetical protein [Falsiroseomonas sp. HW251]
MSTDTTEQVLCGAGLAVERAGDERDIFLERERRRRYINCAAWLIAAFQ